MKRIIIAVLLLAVIAGAAAGGLLLRDETRQLRKENQALVTAAEGRLAQAKAELEAIDPSTVEGEERKLASEQAIVDEAIAKAYEWADEHKEDDEIVRIVATSVNMEY